MFTFGYNITETIKEKIEIIKKSTNLEMKEHSRILQNEIKTKVNEYIESEKKEIEKEFKELKNVLTEEFESLKIDIREEFNKLFIEFTTDHMSDLASLK